MHIHSPAIIHALRSVVKYYPGQNLMGESIIVQGPTYAILVHHEEELREYAEKCHPSRLTEPICPREKDAYHDIKILQEFLEQTIMPDVRIERERNLRGLETFEMSWVRKKPGSTFKFIRDDTMQWVVGVIESVGGGTVGFGGTAWLTGYWYLDFNGSFLGPCKANVLTQRYEGERSGEFMQIIGENAFEEPLDESVKEFVEQGEKCFKLMTKKCQYYDGQTFDFPHHQIQGLVMVDMKKYYSDVDSKKDNPTKPTIPAHRSEKTWLTDCTCVICRKRKEEASRAKRSLELFADFYRIFPEHTKLKPHKFFLLPHKLWAFVFKTRTWEQLHVKDFKEPRFQQDMIDNLVMDASRIKTLKALAGSYIRQNIHGEKTEVAPWSADFIQGKGQGQIILLHGKPGVGKTCTAECIAEYTKRPLMVLTSSDIGADPEKIESFLSDGFKTASSWGAVLLIDEADVFMERRSSNDLNRNCLVAGFLRALEFYDGILFLTTNRVGAFDDAFISRIHVKLYYPDFTDEERQRVWKTFIDKLMKDRGHSIRVSIDAKDFIRGREMREVKWNGREIRNAFQTAVALAEYDAEKDDEGKILLTDTHLRSIVDMSRDFKRYLDETHGADEDKRAAMENIRHDDRRER
ncbi:P-loop containing nucleoside triphosphate hydrolase protein [Stipitochalara longipes BDJ]|nr:P-loop containing nucleoside triphosphate hydrolase protein [Stipitochalara longipes BDJ]